VAAIEALRRERGGAARAREIFSADANLDGEVTEEDWRISLVEHARAQRVQDEALGGVFWAGPLPLSSGDRRLCGALSRTLAGFVAAVGWAAGLAAAAGVGCCLCRRGARAG
jgi:hypothetical protein